MDDTRVHPDDHPLIVNIKRAINIKRMVGPKCPYCSKVVYLNLNGLRRRHPYGSESPCEGSGKMPQWYALDMSRLRQAIKTMQACTWLDQARELMYSRTEVAGFEVSEDVLDGIEAEVRRIGPIVESRDPSYKFFGLPVRLVEGEGIIRIYH